MKKLITRTITGSIYVALIVFTLLNNTSTSFFIFFAALTALGLFEFNHLVGDKSEKIKVTSTIDSIGGLILFTSVYWTINDPDIGLIWLSPYLLYILARLIVELYLRDKNPLTSWAYSFMGQLYIALPLALLNIIYESYGPRTVLALFIFIWLNDTGAFCVGTLIGKRRLFERISPKKSWEGFWGGLILCVLSSIGFYLWGNEFFKGPGLFIWIGFAIVVSVFATWGDLCESLIKRTLNIKDSGKILPGHGGILDRIDSLLLVSPAVLIYFILVSCIMNMHP